MGTDEERADEQAAEWLARLNNRSVTTEELEEFYRWRRKPGNAARYAEIESLWRQARALGDDPDIAAAARDALARPRLERMESEARGWRPSRRVVLAGAALAPVAAGASWLLLPMARAYQTATGEQLVVSLGDGSRIRLNTDSRLHVDAGDTGRRVTLERGQAFFEVKHDPARPFEVRAGKAAIRAAGTQFDVHRSDEAVQVVLTQGSVSVDAGAGVPPTLLKAAGECATIGPAGALAVSHVDVEAATSWTTGRLVFHATPLANAIAEANRYSRTRIELEDPSLAGAKVNGSFETGDMDSFVAAVSALFDLKKRTQENRILLSRN
ncbi:FecR family protein [Sphingomonas kyeonggiensis]|uniref:Transmembrane sensor n=1 Tax=Sphingomonas kyeonggiensis TaxID=1268553 RepID=A0A7W6NY70_9SPHN|nr:FecR domain-containing protein [Sphingomonas kyeonggiensis]MBB4099426.1 transmembrane sensor [Sphingomonas kyeonggiensis]